WCSFTTRCDEAWLALAEDRLRCLGWGHAARGIILAAPTVSKNGYAALIVEVNEGTVRGHASIIDVPAHIAAGIAAGSGVAAVGLGMRSGDPLSLAWVEGRSTLTTDVR